MRRFLRLLPLLVLLAGCGGHTHAHKTVKAPTVPIGCPQAAHGHGAPGVCAPKRLGLLRPQAVSGILFEDRSNNNPCVCGSLLRSQGYVGLIAKANQGTGFVDRWALSQVASARTAGLAVGVYDFDVDYNIAEAQVLVARARAAGIFPSSRNTFPLAFDVEAGFFSYNGLLEQLAFVRAQGYRAMIYTGDWFWRPHAGCLWPGITPAWLSGFPFAVVPCGLPGALFRIHQFTDKPQDTNLWRGSRSELAAFVNATPAPPPRLRCFGPRYSPRHHAKVCDRIRPLTSRRSRARDASRRQYRAHHCRAPERRAVCKVLHHRERYFSRLVQRALRTY